MVHDGQTDGQTHRRMDKQTDERVDRKSDIQRWVPHLEKKSQILFLVMKFNISKKYITVIMSLSGK